MSPSIKLITGIPRSGTSLYCKLINQRGDTVAPHEPIQPASLAQGVSAADAAMNIVSQSQVLDRAMTSGLL